MANLRGSKKKNKTLIDANTLEQIPFSMKNIGLIGSNQDLLSYDQRNMAMDQKVTQDVQAELQREKEYSTKQAKTADVLSTIQKRDEYKKQLNQKQKDYLSSGWFNVVSGQMKAGASTGATWGSMGGMAIGSTAGSIAGGIGGAVAGPLGIAGGIVAGSGTGLGIGGVIGGAGGGLIGGTLGFLSGITGIGLEESPENIEKKVFEDIPETFLNREQVDMEHKSKEEFWNSPTGKTLKDLRVLDEMLNEQASFIVEKKEERNEEGSQDVGAVESDLEQVEEASQKNPINSKFKKKKI